jgi:hypothetical protein
MKAIVLLLAAFVTLPAAAQTISIQKFTPNRINNVAYDPQNGTPNTVTIGLRARNAPAVNYYALAFAPASGQRRLTNANGYSVEYQVLDPARSGYLLRAWSEGQYPQDFLSGSFPTGTAWTNLDLVFNVLLLPGAVVPAATYSGTLTVELYYGTDPAALSLWTSSNYEISATVAQYMDIAVVEVNAPFSAGGTQLVNFGELIAYDDELMDLVVRSNTGYKVSVTSQNGSQLKHSLAEVTTTVPYTLTVGTGGAAQTFTLPEQLVLDIVEPSAWTSGGEARYLLTFKIGFFDNAAAGDYNDNLTFTISAP